MELLSARETSQFTTDLLSEKHQVHGYYVDLTAGKVSEMVRPGEIDFGGSEQCEAGQQDIDPVKKGPEDKYGWWELKPGHYFVTFNEKVSMPEGRFGVIQPHNRTVTGSASHASFHIMPGETAELILLTVAGKGLNIKENARISQLIAFRI